MAIYSNPVKIAFRILVNIAESKKNKARTVMEVASATGISKPTVAKTLQILARNKLLGSQKGPGGGFWLGCPAQEISLMRIMIAIEGKNPFEECIWGFDECSEKSPCPIHEKWACMKVQLENFLQNTTLKDIQLSKKDIMDLRVKNGENDSPLESLLT